MKFAMIALMAFASVSVAHADGFVCEGQGLNAKMYDHVTPARGTRNSAVLVVSSQENGTIAVVQAPSKQINPETVTYGGETNAYYSGRFTAAYLDVSKAQNADGSISAVLYLAEDGTRQTVDMSCERYLKQ